MSDLVEQLRSADGRNCPTELLDRAADEIAKLRAALEALDAVLDFSVPVVSYDGFQFIGKSASDFNKAIEQARLALSK